MVHTVPVIESDEPEPPKWLTPDSDPDSPLNSGADGGADSGADGGSGSSGPGSRQTLLLVGGGAVVLVLVAGLAVFGLYSATAGTTRPRPKSAAAEPIVLVPSAEPGAETPTQAGTPSSMPTKTTPAPAKTTVAASPGRSQVTAASFSVEPASASGPCPRMTRYVRVTMKVTITVSVPEVRLRYTVDGGKELGTVMRSKTYTDTWETNVKRAAGTYTSTLKVTAPSAASDTATFTYTCD